jgi:hypothetical protein
MVDRERRRPRRDGEEPSPPSAPDIGSMIRLPVNRTGIGALFSDEDIALMISIWDEEDERESRKARKRQRPGPAKPAP